MSFKVSHTVRTSYTNPIYLLLKHKPSDRPSDRLSDKHMRYGMRYDRLSDMHHEKHTHYDMHHEKHNDLYPQLSVSMVRKLFVQHHLQPHQWYL